MASNNMYPDAKPPPRRPVSIGIAQSLNVRPGEGKLVTLILLYTIGSFTANVLIYTAAYALFLNEFNAQSLPYIYIGESIVSALLTLLYLRLSQRYALTNMLFGQLAVGLVTLLGYRLGLLHWTNGWFIFSLPIWYAVLNNQMNSAFWTLLGRLFNIQQGKRLFGLLTAGQDAATVSVGLLIPLLVAGVGTPNLLLLAALGMVGAGWALACMAPIAPAMQASEVVEAESEPAANAAQNTLFADAYIRLIFVALLLFGLSDNMIDNLFYAQAGGRFSDQNQLATFLGAFTAIVGGVNLLSQLFLASRLLRRFGVSTIVLLTPVALLVTIMPFVLVGTFAHLSPLLFWLAVAINLTRRVTDKFDNTASNLLYQPLPAALRAQTQTVMDGIFAPAVGGLAGLLLLTLNNVLGFTALQLAYLLLPLVGVWVLVASRLGRLYGQRVQQALRQRIIQGNSAFQPDRASLESLRQHLSDPHPGAVIYALDMLEAAEDATLGETLPPLLQHPNRHVRLDVLARLERLSDPMFLPALQHCWQNDPDPQVRAVALQSWAALGGLSESDAIDYYLSAADPHLRQAAMIGLLRSGALEGLLAVGETLTKLVYADAVADRVFAAQVLGESRLAGFYRPLLTLLHDREASVQQAALVAAAKLQHPKLWPVVIAALASPQTRAAAQTTLVAGGAAVLPAFQQALSQAGQAAGQDRQLRSTLAYVCGRIHAPQSTALLLTQLTYPDVMVRTQTLYALHQSGYRADAATRPQLVAELQAEVAHARWILTHLVGLGEPKQGVLRLLRNELCASLVQQQRRLLLWLALLYDPAIIQRVRTALGLGPGIQRTPTAEQRAYALETLDFVLAKSISKPILLLFDDLPPAQQHKQLIGDAPPTPLTLSQCLTAIIAGDERWVASWLRTIALYTVTHHLPAVEGDSVLHLAVAQQAASADPLVQETAAWVLTHLNAAPRGATPAVEQNPLGTLRTVEKVLILQRVDLFAATPAAILVEIAARLQELFVPAGATIFAQGAPGDSMYLIVSGAVEALDGARVFTQMGEREVFGEMALLDGEPRTATIRTTQDTQLLRLDQGSFYALIDEHIEIARGVIHVLLQRLRARTADLNQLQAQLAAITANGSSR